MDTNLTITYSWGPLYDAVKECENYEEERKKFAVFEALDKATTKEEAKQIITPLIQYEIDWLNSPCLDGLVAIRCDSIASLAGPERDYSETCKYYLSKNWASKKDIEHLFLSCCLHNSVKILTLLAENNLLIHNRLNYDRLNYSLETACQLGYTEIVRILLENGANVKYNGESALYLARNHTELIKLLVEKGADIHKGDDFIFVNACERKNVEIVKFALSYNPENLLDAFTIVAQENHTEILQILLDHLYTYSLSVTNIEKYRSFMVDTTFEKAFECNSFDVFKLLLNYKPDTNNIKRKFPERLEMAKIILDSSPFDFP